MTAQIQQLTSELTLERINEIPVLTLNHPVGSARIALQGAQLLNWQPKGAEQDIFWLSEIEPKQFGGVHGAVFRLMEINGIIRPSENAVCGKTAQTAPFNRPSVFPPPAKRPRSESPSAANVRRACLFGRDAAVRRSRRPKPQWRARNTAASFPGAWARTAQLAACRVRRRCAWARNPPRQTVPRLRWRQPTHGPSDHNPSAPTRAMLLMR